jgi:hypothetical protein
MENSAHPIFDWLGRPAAPDHGDAQGDGFVVGHRQITRKLMIVALLPQAMLCFSGKQEGNVG